MSPPSVFVSLFISHCPTLQGAIIATSYIVHHCLYTILIGPSLSHEPLDGVHLQHQAIIHHESHDHLVGYSLQELLSHGKLIREDGHILSLIKQGLIEALHTPLYHIQYFAEHVPHIQHCRGLYNPRITSLNVQYSWVLLICNTCCKYHLSARSLKYSMSKSTFSCSWSSPPS